MPELNELPFWVTVQERLNVLPAPGPVTPPVTVIGMPIMLMAGTPLIATWSMFSVEAVGVEDRVEEQAARQARTVVRREIRREGAEGQDLEGIADGWLEIVDQSDVERAV